MPREVEIELQRIKKPKIVNIGNSVWQHIALFSHFEVLLVLLRIDKSFNRDMKSEHIWSRRLLLHRPQLAENVSSDSSYQRLIKELKTEAEQRRSNDRKNSQRETQLMVAFAEGNLETINRLNFSISDVPFLYERKGRHAFSRARQNNRQNTLDICYKEKIVPFFRNTGRDQDRSKFNFRKKDQNDWDILSHAILFGQSTAVIGKILKELESLLRYSIYRYRDETEVSVNFNLPALHVAIWSENTIIVRFLLTYARISRSRKIFFDPNIATRDHRRWPLDSRWNKNSLIFAGSTPLHASVQLGNVMLTALLLENHARFDYLSRDGLAPPALAIKLRYHDVFQTFLPLMNVNQPVGEWGKTSLHFAAKFGRVTPVRMLAKQGDVDWNATDSEEGETALHLAMKKSDFHIARLLILECGVDTTIRTTNHGYTVLHYIEYHNTSPEYIQNALWLIENVDPQVVNVNAPYGRSAGEYPLVLAVHYNNVVLVKALLARGADPDVGVRVDNVFELARTTEIKYLLIHAQLKAYIEKLLSGAGEAKPDPRLFSTQPLLKTALCLLNALVEQKPINKAVLPDDPALKADPALERLYKRAGSIDYQYLPASISCPKYRA